MLFGLSAKQIAKIQAQAKAEVERIKGIELANKMAEEAEKAVSMRGISKEVRNMFSYASSYKTFLTDELKVRTDK